MILGPDKDSVHFALNAIAFKQQITREFLTNGCRELWGVIRGKIQFHSQSNSSDSTSSSQSTGSKGPSRNTAVYGNRNPNVNSDSRQTQPSTVEATQPQSYQNYPTPAAEVRKRTLKLDRKQPQPISPQ